MAEKTFPYYDAINLRFNPYLALAGIAGPVLLIITDIVVALTNPGYIYVRHSISSLAWAPLGWLQTISFLTIGLLTELFVASLFCSITPKRGFNISMLLLIIFGFGLLMIGAFPTDPAVGEKTIEGTIHGIAAKFVFVIFPIATLFLLNSIKADENWRPVFKYTLCAAIFSIMVMIPLMLLPGHWRFWGLLERILVADTVIWVAVMASRMLMLSKHKF
jgi:hypothetical membrane protein